MDFLGNLPDRLWQLICYEKMSPKLEGELKRIYHELDNVDIYVDDYIGEQCNEAWGEVDYWKEEYNTTKNVKHENDELTRKVEKLEKELKQYKKIGEQFSAGNKTVKLFRKGLS